MSTFLDLSAQLPFRPFGAIIDNDVHFLRETVPNAVKNDPTQIQWLNFSHPRGRDIYRRSLSFLLKRAVSTLHRNSRLAIGHSISGGYYWDFFTDQPVTQDLLDGFLAEMKKQVESGGAIEQIRLSKRETIELFRQLGRPDKVRLLEQLERDNFLLYRCGEFHEMDHGVLLPDLSFLTKYDLITRSPGFIMRFPGEDGELPVINHQKKLFQIYRESKNWENILEVSNLGRLNEKIQTKRIGEFIKVVEAFHERKICRLADEIHHQRENVRVILISGPSASGKTTFAKRLCIQLKVLGIRTKAISLDNYFVPRVNCPRDDRGEYDFEHLDAVDRELLNRHLLDLFEGRTVEQPVYDFESGSRKAKPNPFRLEPDEMLVLEGIHGLNPKLTFSVDESYKFKIYISCLTQITIDDMNRVSTTNTRLLRRLVRDKQFRGYSPDATIRRWPSVRAGERNHIFPYQENADMMMNSALTYELAVLKPYAESSLRSIQPQSPAYLEAQRLLHILEYIHPIKDLGEIPPTSILREFIGGSAFNY